MGSTRAAAAGAPLEHDASDALLPLNSRHRAAILAHLLALGAEDRANRFTGTVSDAHVGGYVERLGHARDILIGAWQHGPRAARLAGLAHAAVYLEHGDLVAEVGVSVAAGARRRGLGKRLLRAAIAAAERFNVRRVSVLFRSTNIAMAALARSVGGRVERDGSESSAVFDVAASPALPLHTVRNAQGSEVLPATHPRERGRKLPVHRAGGDGGQRLPRLVPALRAAGFSLHAPTLIVGHSKAGGLVQR